MSRYDELTEQFDCYPPAEAVARAWRDPGPRYGTWHPRAREEIAFLMPLLARALDRLLLEMDLGEPDHELWAEMSAAAATVPDRAHTRRRP